MKNKKKILFPILLLILLSILFFCGKEANVSNNKYSEKELEVLVREYQLTSGMFFDNKEESMSIDAFSTCYMMKIRKLVYGESIEIDPILLDFTFDNMEEIYYLQDVILELPDDALNKYEKYIEEIIQQDGLVSFSEEDDESSRMIFSLYVIKFAKQFELGFERQDLIKSNIQQKLQEVTNDNDIFYISTLLQLSHHLGIEYDRDFFLEYYSDKMEYIENLPAIMDGDIMDLYYLSIMNNILQIDSCISQNLISTITEAVSYSYTNLSLLYDCIYILDSYSVLEENVYIINEYIEALEEYRIDDNKYSAIQTITPSILATCCGVELLKDIGKLEETEKNRIINYLKSYYDNDMLTYMSCDDLYHYYKCLYNLECDWIYDGVLIEKIVDICRSRLVSSDTLSVRELYCIYMLDEVFLQNTDFFDLLKNKLKETMLLVDIDSLSEANKSMLLILTRVYGENNFEISQIEEGIDVRLNTIMDIYYYVEYCNIYGIEINENAVGSLLTQLKNDGGYYISRYQQENSMFTLYLGYILSND